MKLQSFCKAVELKVFGEKKKRVKSNTSHSASVKDQSFITGGGGGGVVGLVQIARVSYLFMYPKVNGA